MLAVVIHVVHYILHRQFIYEATVTEYTPLFVPKDLWLDSGTVFHRVRGIFIEHLSDNLSCNFILARMPACCR